MRCMIVGKSIIIHLTKLEMTMNTMRAMQVQEPGGDFKPVEVDIPEPEADQVRIKVEACGICHSDQFIKDNLFPNLTYPRIPGHEVIGVVDKVGDHVEQWSEGQRVGVGWHGGHCFECEACRSGDFVNCENAIATGIYVDGGYAEYMVANQEAVAVVPEDLNSAEAAPLLCAGITTFNPLRNSNAQPGDIVAVQGIGGLGHLAVQFAAKSGFRTVAISRSVDKESLAYQLGADDFILDEDGNAAEKLQEMGGAKVILATAPSAQAASSIAPGLGRNGKMFILGVSNEPIEISAIDLIMGRKSIGGWPSGSPKASEETLSFSDLSGVTAMVETYPLEKANEAYDRMINNEARFRVVLEVD